MSYIFNLVFTSGEVMLCNFLLYQVHLNQVRDCDCGNKEPLGSEKQVKIGT